MKLFSVSLLLIVLSVPAWAQSNAQNAVQPEPPMLGLHWARGANPNSGATASPDMSWHGGDIMTTAVTQAIFWGTSWATYTGDKITGMDLWYEGVGGSPYAKTSDEYLGNGSTNNIISGSTTSLPDEVTSIISYNGHLMDTTAAPSHAPSTSTILKEVCKEITSPVSNGYYAVYVDTPRHGANYCAWHSWGTCGGTQVQFAFFFNLDGDAGCDPQSTVAGESQGLKALANVSGHELSEARSDPRGNAWYDSSGQENADKCAWAFGSSSVYFSSTNTYWKIQGNWSNYAYDHNLGYLNRSGQDGCLDGGGTAAIAP